MNCPKCNKRMKKQLWGFCVHDRRSKDMLVRVCDCCGKEMKKDFISFHINWAMADVVSGETENKKETYSLEYCEKCFSDVLEKLGLETKE